MELCKCKFLKYLQVVLNTILLFQNKTYCPPILDSDDYDTLFEARHGRGALDHMPRTSERGNSYFLNRDDPY